MISEKAMIICHWSKHSKGHIGYRHRGNDVTNGRTLMMTEGEDVIWKTTIVTLPSCSQKTVLLLDPQRDDIAQFLW